MNQARRGVIPLNMQRINLQRSSFLLPFLLAFLACADFAAERTRFDLQQLKAPPGFHISVFSENIDGARMIVFSPGGVLLVSESAQGKVVALPDDRLKLAEKIGAVAIDDSTGDAVEKVLALTEGLGADCGCEAVGYQCRSEEHTSE